MSGPAPESVENRSSGVEEGHTERARDTHWLVDNPVRTGMLLILLLSTAVRYNILRDSFFITDDFMLTSRAVENALDWDYLTRVHTGHFEPVGFAVMWVLARVAPWNWGITVVVLLTAQVLVSVLVWRLLTELFTRRALVLVPFGLYCLTPMTIPAFTWLSAAIIWIPLIAALAGASRSHARYLRTGRFKDAAWATAWFVFGLASFEKILIFLPFAIAFTVAISPQVPLRLGPLTRLARRTWQIWVGYGLATVAYVFAYVQGSSQTGATSQLGLPSLSQLWDFSFLSFLRTFVPGTLGGPWDWQPAGYGGAMVNSPRGFDWVTWFVAGAAVLVSLVFRRHIGRAWFALLVYLAGSIGALALGRAWFSGGAAGLETRYLADAVIPLVIVVGMLIMPLRGETSPWLATAGQVRSAVPPSTLISTAVALGVLWLSLALHSANGYANLSAANPYRDFVQNAKQSINNLPKRAQVYDAPLPVGILGPLFEEYNLTSRFLAPVAPPDVRRELYNRQVYTRPYMLTAAGRIVPMRVAGSESPAPLDGLCGWQPVDGEVAIPLKEAAFDWPWAVRVGYLAGGRTPGVIELGDDSQRVSFRPGLGEIVVHLVGGDNEVRITDLDESVSICFGDAQVGNPVPHPDFAR